VNADQVILEENVTEISTMSGIIDVNDEKNVVIESRGQPTLRPTSRPTIGRTARPTIRPTGRPTTRLPNQFPTTILPNGTSRRLYPKFSHDHRHLVVAQFIWGGSSSWTCRGCGLDINDASIYIPGLNVILDLIYGTRGPMRIERLVSNEITTSMQAEIAMRLLIPNIVVGCLQNSTFATYYKDLSYG
jgi:hypothetical protein